MRKAIRRQLYVVFVALLCGCAGAPILTPLPPESETALLGAWIGYDRSRDHFYQVVLEPHGKATLASLYKTNDFDYYSVRTWSLDNNVLFVILQVSPGQPRPPAVRGQVRGTTITLRVQGENWQQMVELVPMARVQSDIAAMQNFLRQAARRVESHF